MDKEKLVGIFRTFFSKLSPPLHVGGIHITDFAVSYAGVKGKGVIRETLRLPPGVVEGGRVKNRDALAAVLAELRIRVYPDLKKPLSVVLTMPIRDVYIQTFKVPQVEDENFEEAAELNAKMISPINVENAYYDWQRLLSVASASTEVDMLGAFVQKQIVDDLIDVIEFSGFGVAAVEFESMSVARSISNANLLGPGKPYIAVQVGVDGINFIVVRKDLPHFHYFHPWAEVQGDGKVVSIDNFKSSLRDELERVINFYLTHWTGESIEDVVVATPEFGKEITDLIKDEFRNLKVQIIEPQRVAAVLGAALRGSSQRFADTEISLANISALGVFQKQQLWNFARVWRNIFVTSTGFLLLLFFASNLFLRTELGDLMAKKNSLLSNPDLGEYADLRTQVEEFNVLVSRFTGIRGGEFVASVLLDKINSLKGTAVELTRIDYSPSDSKISVNGIATSEDVAVDFKNRIEEVPQFSDVSLPLRNISREGDSISFNLEFKVVSFDFPE